MIRSFSESKWASSKSYLYGKSLRNAPRATKIHFFIRYNHHDPLWWTGSLSPVLQIAGPSSLRPALCALAQLFPPQLPSSRSILGSCLCHRGRHWTHREYPKSYSQRSASAPSWPTRIPPSRHFTDLPLALRHKELAKPTSRSRQTEGGTFSTSESSLQRYCRCRYHNAYNLWLSRRGSRGLYSQAASWSALLCAHHLQRRTKWSESGNGAESRQRSCIQRSLGLFAIHPEETSFLHCIQPHACPTGWSFLQQRDHRTPRPRTAGLCGCSQDDPTVEKKDGGGSIRTVRRRLGGSRVCLHTLSLERRTPVRCSTKTRGFGDRRDPTAFVHLQALHLPPGAGDQSGADRSGSLALLLRPSVSGAFAARVQRFLRYGQNSNPQFLGQCGLHGDPSVGLRFGSGLPVSLLAQASAALEYRHLAPRALVAACGMGQAGKQKLSQTPGTLPAAGVVPKNSVGCFESPALDLNPFAMNFQNRTSET